MIYYISDFKERDGVVRLKHKKLASGVCAALVVAGFAGVGMWVKEHAPQNFVIETQTEAMRETQQPAASISAAPASSAAETTANTEGKININTATLYELDRLDGIGEKMAQRIIDYREQHGPFEVPEDLMKVSGIGAKNFAAIKDDICVE